MAGLQEVRLEDKIPRLPLPGRSFLLAREVMQGQPDGMWGAAARPSSWGVGLGGKGGSLKPGLAQGFLPEERLNAWLSARHIITKTMIIADVYEVFTMSGAVPDTQCAVTHPIFITTL